MPQVSVIIPAYNAERFIDEAIVSVLSQTWACVECVVVDDGSTDGTVSRVKQYSDRVKLVNQENRERSVARNTGVQVSSGDYVSFLDADDYISLDKIEQQVNFLETHPDYEVVYSSVRYFMENGRRKFYSPKRKTPVGDVFPDLIYHNQITVNAPLMTRVAFERSGGFDPGFSHYEDWDLLLRLALTGASFGYLEGCHAFCRRHETNTDRDRLRMKEGKLRVAEKIVHQFDSDIERKNISSSSVLAFHLADYGRALIMEGRRDEGLQVIQAACREQFPSRGFFQVYSGIASIFGLKPLEVFEGLLVKRKRL